ncbi:BTAD domain-containing putative transcriptional regulator [Kutzneria sp. NPDC052558]|uniref:BTAD domain-containing putative transcriptional regulator n=1 Tax=Kutzneria sp. NPDC052558 TaxID=3364121 RepID=UPI0037CADFDF
MELRLLGPVRARVADTVVELGPRQQRLVLAVLAWEVNRVVPTERLFEWLWPADPPRSATHALHVLVSNLRSILAEAGAGMTISTEGTGYVLHADPRRIDVHRFTDAVARARASAGDRTRVTLLDEALRLWTGPALADTASPEIRERLCGGLEETRLTAVEDRFDGILRLGGHQEVLGEITAAAEAHPTRERLVGQLMLALHRSGQTSRALEVAQRARSRLAEELGIDPGAELRRLELAILRDDRDLDPVTEPATPLPAHRTRLIGRDRAVADLVDRLATGEARLLTLTGPGGVGKTRLATEVARRTGDRVAVVSLASVRDPGLVLPTVASGLELREMAGVPLRAALRAHLRDLNLLLLLDNVEHLLDAAPDIAWLLDVSPRLTVLATSRTPLRLGGEHVWPVKPLDARSAAELFVERARQAGYADGDDPAVVDAICGRVDRLPLGIELAAARTRLLSPAALLDQLERSHDLLTDGARDAPPRHQALRAAIAWSYDLLSTEEQALLCAVSVFAGGWNAATAAAAANVDPTTAWRLLGGLLDAGLIFRRPCGDVNSFALLETVRVFAMAQAEATGVLPELRERHAVHVESFVAAARWGVEGPDQHKWFTRLRWQQDNIRAALRWLLDRGELDRCAAILVFPTHWIIGGHIAEYRRWAHEVLAGDSLSLAARAGVLAIHGYVSHGSRSEQAIRVTDEAMELARLAGDPRTLALALLLRGNVAVWSRDDAFAAALFDEADAAFRAAGGSGYLAVARAAKAHMAVMQGRAGEADRALAELEAEGRRAGGGWALAMTLVYRGTVLIRLDAWDHAERLLREAVEIVSRLGLASGFVMLWALHHLSVTAAHTGRPERSARLAGAAALLVDRFGPSMAEDIARLPSRRATSRVSAEIGRAAFDALYREGRAMTLDQAVALATAPSAELAACGQGRPGSVDPRDP